jgi:flagellar motility protein MotE (MotC chaperone)
MDIQHNLQAIITVLKKPRLALTELATLDHRLQAIITALKDENKKLQDENKKLQDEIKRKEEYRRLYVVWDDSA